ncbi:SCO family protein [Paenibacillus sp. N1-5-1-14]|uniref:SCO family protein n=1 Tax=Paenibacillus radicibacter TaxID=2972488 RepID=UPI002158FCB1|nr:SCO family protein [Paenibacillus radicibacter]MCR8645306.1 SCO family protein [Paenibacillus radicibacter]
MASLSKNWFKIATVVILLAIIGTFAYKLWFKDETASALKVLQQAPEFELQSTDSKQMKFSEYDDKVRLVYFFFASCPDVCPPTTQYLSKVQLALKDKDLFGTKAHMFSITMDPEKDTLAKLTQYSQGYGVDPTGWSFLRGDEEGTRVIGEKFGVAIIHDKKKDTFIHTNVIVLVDKKGQVRNYYDPNDEKNTPEQIAKDVAALAKEK